MLQKLAFLLFWGITLTATAVYGLRLKDGDVTLAPPSPPKPTILGIPFEATPATASELLTEQGLTLLSQEAKDNKGCLQVLTFDGIPQGLQINEGRSRLVFFKNKLTRMDFLFTPSYQNFLIVRDCLFRSLGQRFTIDKQQQLMDNYLRAHLANINDNEFDNHAEDLIRQSMLLGKTCFFYSLKDQYDELNVTYSFTSSSDSEGEKTPSLMLHYSLKNNVEAYNSYSDALQRGALQSNTPLSSMSPLPN